MITQAELEIESRALAAMALCPDEVALLATMRRHGYGINAVDQMLESREKWADEDFADWRELFVSWLSDRWARDTDTLVTDD